MLLATGNLFSYFLCLIMTILGKIDEKVVGHIQEQYIGKQELKSSVQIIYLNNLGKVMLIVNNDLKRMKELVHFLLQQLISIQKRVCAHMRNELCKFVGNGMLVITLLELCMICMVNEMIICIVSYAKNCPYSLLLGLVVLPVSHGPVL